MSKTSLKNTDSKLEHSVFIGFIMDLSFKKSGKKSVLHLSLKTYIA